MLQQQVHLVSVEVGHRVPTFLGQRFETPVHLLLVGLIQMQSVRLHRQQDLEQRPRVKGEVIVSHLNDAAYEQEQRVDDFEAVREVGVHLRDEPHERRQIQRVLFMLNGCGDQV